MCKKKCFVVVMTLLTFAVFTSVVAYGGIMGTKHDLSPATPREETDYSPAQTIYASSRTEKCVFCHTPHATANDYPLWNHALSGATYTGPQQQTSSWPTLLSPGVAPGTSVWAPIPGGQPDKGSKLCLCCHDGTVAVGAVRNTPGRGTTSSISMVGVTPEGYIPPGAYGYIGTNLTNKHPFSIAVNDDLISDKLARCPLVAWALQYPPPGDPVKLRSTANTYEGKPGRNGEGIQCRSCHDPHDDSNGDFLVKGNPTPGDNTPLCETCHISCPH